MGVWIETVDWLEVFGILKVTPLVGVWIETKGTLASIQVQGVTPLVGVWIETDRCAPMPPQSMSLPSWECGLKPSERADPLITMGHSPRGSVD